MNETEATRSDHISALVREQYERFPYPDLEPDELPKGWAYSSLIHEMCPLIWGGRRQPKDIVNVLDAGCGTGGPSAKLALIAPWARVVGIDLSEASLARSQARKERLGIDNLEYHHLSILDVEKLGITFDYIVSSGVIHHMPDPNAGLTALRNVLDPQGAIALMLYGLHGRRGIYMLQRAMQLAGNPDEEIGYHIELARTALRSAPPWYPAHTPAYAFETQPGNDGGVVDLLLHVQDRAYTAADVHEMLEACDMRLRFWIRPSDYDPMAHFDQDPVLSVAAQKAGPAEAAYLAELAHGGMHKHSFVATRPEFELPALDIAKGAWRKLGIVNTFFFAWDRPMTSQDGRSIAFPTSTAEEGRKSALILNGWQLEFVKQLSTAPTRIIQIAESPTVQRAMPRGPRHERDPLIEEFLQYLVREQAVALIEEACFEQSE